MFYEMATFQICIFEHQEREDGTFPVSIRVTWKRNSAYIKTEYRVVKKQLTKSFELKDAFLLRELNNRIARCEEIKLHKLGQKIENYSAKELSEFFVKHSKPEGIDFISFAREHVGNIESQGRKTYAVSFKSTINALVDFFGRDNIPVTYFDFDNDLVDDMKRWLLDLI